MYTSGSMPGGGRCSWCIGWWWLSGAPNATPGGVPAAPTGIAAANAGGRIAIGSDSNVLISAAEELRWLEYSQRFRDRARNVLAVNAASTGRALFDAAARGGAQSSGQAIGALKTGNRADIVTLDADHAALAGLEGDGWLDGWIFGGGSVDKVWTGGTLQVSGGRHRNRDAIQSAYRKAVADLTA